MQIQQMAPVSQTPDPLAELRDIHLPQDVGAWPPAPGWWLLALALLLTCYFCWRWWLRRRRSVRRYALIDLQKLEQSFHQKRDSISFVVGLSNLLRRVALASHPSQKVASLYGESWIEFLSTNLKEDFRDEFRYLEKVTYEPQSSFDQGVEPQRVAQAVRMWIRRNAA